MITSTAFERLKRAVVERTGHHYYVDKDKLLYERARERMKARGVATMEAYLALLESGEGAEWRALEDVITVGETYFFRYPDHFETLRNIILPRLIERRRTSHVLRIWSMGCSTGAEPYSLAILLREVLGDEIGQWRISLIGGDISEKALAAARAARFSDWALRTMGPEDRARYFTKEGSVFVLKPEYCSMVRFERQNILALLSEAPPLEWSGFDLILCRNVLIYFSPQQAIEIVGALKRCLEPDGALLLGHAEAMLGTDVGQLVMQPLPTEYTQALQPAPVAPWMPAELPAVPVAPRIAAPSIVPQSAEGDIDRLQALADAGAYEEAETLCRALIAANPTSARLQYYDAVLRQVSDDPVGAEAALKRALYLDRNFTLAHHRLGMLLLSLGRAQEARRSLLSAARLAEAAPANDLLPEGQGVSAGVFSAALREQIGRMGDAA